MTKTDRNQGEGDKAAARRFNKAEQRFISEGGVEKAQANDPADKPAAADTREPKPSHPKS